MIIMKQNHLKLTILLSATKIIRVFKNFDIGSASSKEDPNVSGGNNDMFDVNEVQEGLNNLLNLQLTKN